MVQRIQAPVFLNPQEPAHADSPESPSVVGPLNPKDMAKGLMDAASFAGDLLKRDDAATATAHKAVRKAVVFFAQESPQLANARVIAELSFTRQHGVPAEITYLDYLSHTSATGIAKEAYALLKMRDGSVWQGLIKQDAKTREARVEFVPVPEVQSYEAVKSKIGLAHYRKAATGFEALKRQMYRARSAAPLSKGSIVPDVGSGEAVQKRFGGVVYPMPNSQSATLYTQTSPYLLNQSKKISPYGNACVAVSLLNAALDRMVKAGRQQELAAYDLVALGRKLHAHIFQKYGYKSGPYAGRIDPKFYDQGIKGKIPGLALSGDYDREAAAAASGRGEALLAFVPEFSMDDQAGHVMAVTDIDLQNNQVTVIDSITGGIFSYPADQVSAFVGLEVKDPKKFLAWVNQLPG